MQGNWNHGRPHYRCRYPAEYAGIRDDARRATIYVREDAVVPKLDALLARWFDSDHIDETVKQLVAAVGPTDEDTARVEPRNARSSSATRPL
jgi:hypothetical protein